MTKQVLTYGSLFDHLEQQLTGGETCDHTLRMTKKFAEEHDISFGKLSQILEGMSGFCDCEVLLNAARKIPARDIIGQESFTLPRQLAIEQGLYCHCRVNGKPVSFEEAVKAAQAGLSVEHWIPCAKDDPHAMPDLNRAVKMLHESTEHKS
jgi:hypothetical protein